MWIAIVEVGALRGLELPIFSLNFCYRLDVIMLRISSYSMICWVLETWIALHFRISKCINIIETSYLVWDKFLLVEEMNLSFV